MHAQASDERTGARASSCPRVLVRVRALPNMVSSSAYLIWYACARARGATVRAYTSPTDRRPEAFSLHLDLLGKLSCRRENDC